MKLAVFMDPLDKIKAYKDSSVAMLKCAQAQGMECYFFTIDDLYSRDGRAFANLKQINITDPTSSSWADVHAIGEKNLDFLDIILIRLDPPFNMQYIYALQVLELAEAHGVLVANKPSSLCMLGEKTYTTHFADCCPVTLVSADVARLKSFWEEHRDVIYKPLDGMGGRGIFHVDNSGANLAVILELLTNNQQTMIMAQKYIPEITTHGDRRILLINGKPVAHALARMPATGEFRGNLNAGATGVVQPLSSAEYSLCDKIAADFQARGLYFVGIDVIGEYLTEINITSPTCITEIDKATGSDIAGDYISFLRDLRLRA